LVKGIYRYEKLVITPSLLTEAQQQLSVLLRIPADAPPNTDMTALSTVRTLRFESTTDQGTITPLLLEGGFPESEVDDPETSSDEERSPFRGKEGRPSSAPSKRWIDPGPNIKLSLPESRFTAKKTPRQESCRYAAPPSQLRPRLPGLPRSGRNPIPSPRKERRSRLNRSPERQEEERPQTPIAPSPCLHRQRVPQR
jgi:hypothetical protein